MNKTETEKVLAILEIPYDRYCKGLSQKQKDNLLMLWTKLFRNDEYKTVIEAVEYFVMADTKGFFPAIGAIREMMYKMSNDQPTEIEAWNTVVKALGKAYYEPTKSWNTLSEPVQRVVGSAEQLRQWSLVDTDTLNSVVASNFQRSYRAIAAKQKERQILLPENMKRKEIE